MKTVALVKKIRTKNPKDAYNELKRHYNIAYSREEGNMKYVGFDISELNDKHKIAEVILLNDSVVQVRNLVDNPYWANEIKFGGF